MILAICTRSEEIIVAIIKEIADGLKTVAEAIKNIRTITEAVKEGRNYVAARHPEIQKDLALMVGEMRKNLVVVSDASAVLTRFRFAVAPDTGSAELARFNDYFIEQERKASDLRAHVDDLRGHCSVIREHAARISGEATASGFAVVFEMLNLRSAEREQKLGKILDRLAYEDFEIANVAEIMLSNLEGSLRDVQDTLGERGTMNPKNIRKAAKRLSEYADAFRKIEDPARNAAKDIQTLARDLQK